MHKHYEVIFMKAILKLKQRKTGQDNV